MFGNRLFAIPLLLLFAILAPPPVAAQAPDARMTIAIHAAPPFVSPGQDGEWSGLAVELWNKVSGDLDLDYRFVDADLPAIFDGVADGKYAAGVGALTITPGREARVDFTHPYHTTGFGIAVPKTKPSWMLLLGNFFSWGFLQAVLALGALLGIVGVLFWLAERRANPDQFGGGAKRGIGSGFWFSAVTMTTVGYGDKAPATAAGKAVALVWMFAAILIISTFTGMIASSLTEGRLQGGIKSPDELGAASVGSIEGSAADDWLAQRGVGFSSYDSVEAGLDAVASGKIDAFVYDRPLLAHLLKGDRTDTLRLVPGTFGRQDYGFALPQGSPLREPLNRAILKRIESHEWTARLQQVLGRE